jgi:hypothetical protein
MADTSQGRRGVGVRLPGDPMPCLEQDSARDRGPLTHSDDGLGWQELPDRQIPLIAQGHRDGPTSVEEPAIEASFSGIQQSQDPGFTLQQRRARPQG